jgi:hypothetical protein
VTLATGKDISAYGQLHRDDPKDLL